MPKKSEQRWPAGNGAVGDQIRIAIDERYVIGDIVAVGFANKHDTPCVVQAVFAGKRRFVHVHDEGVIIIPANVPPRAARFAQQNNLTVILEPSNTEESHFQFVDRYFNKLLYATGTVELADFCFNGEYFYSGKPCVDDGFSELRFEHDSTRRLDVPEDFHEYM